MLILSPESACDICLDPYTADGGKEPASLNCGMYELLVMCGGCSRSIDNSTNRTNIANLHSFLLQGIHFAGKYLIIILTVYFLPLYNDSGSRWLT